MRARLLPIGGIVVLCGAAVAPARARAQTSLAVLGIEPHESTANLATAVTRELRQRAASASGFTVLPHKELVELKLVFSCADEAPTCMARAGRALGARKLLFGGVRRGSAGWELSLKWFDVETARVERSLDDRIPAETELPAQSGRWFSQLSGTAPSLAGRPGPPGPPVRPSPASPASPTEAAEHPNRGARIAFWSSVAALAASATAAVGFGMHVWSLEDDKRRAISTSPSTDVRNAGTGANVCAIARQSGAQGDPSLARLCDDGDQSATLTNVFIGLGVASLAASAYFYYKGYVDTPPPGARASAPRPAGSRLRVAPEVYGKTRGGGLIAEFEF